MPSLGVWNSSEDKKEPLKDSDPRTVIYKDHSCESEEERLKRGVKKEKGKSHEATVAIQVKNNEWRN